ncbi:penicillin acylase family protein [Mucilaginibacter flavus]|uniref:penicillin acylase family protein n=1 Tax=Mucilaginibacter flavus TaxID=931504 RepID=UPI0025B5A97C|nr:penicillin acylase family protein [Mucilaginibacter flavus]MDN3581229.1 penicillin acylase family protein [Mucilaginibacter flavus]
MKLIKAFFSIAFTLTLIWMLQTKFGPVPPLGKFLSPADGFWQNAESKNIATNSTLKLPGLQGAVTVKYDENRIPHIFAQNEHDLYYAQGYITATNRLWQMDIQTRSAAGRLAEVAGDQALEIDRYHRRMGMVYGAENSLKAMMADKTVRQMILAYTDGINDYIHQLGPREYPLEFKLLDYAPEDWKPINCAFLLKLMSETLAGGSNEFAMSNILKKFGATTTNDLFPDYPSKEDPIIPVGTKWNFKPLPIPKPSAGFLAQMNSEAKRAVKEEGIGSNNWAVSGSKTANGYPILANDPHLDLTFPSIWFQVQLSAPGMNVYGVSLPGAPCVILGFNNNISWGITNVDADVLDWYQVKFKDATKNEYWYNNKWNKTTRRVEVINVRGQAPLYDTVIYTHHGPVVYEDKSKTTKHTPKFVPVGDALRWIAHDESDELMAMYILNTGKNYDDYRKALTFFNAPASNFVFASKDNDIAITPNGKFPLKFKDQGKFILDGSDPANDWHGWIPFDQNPTVKNPPRGFVSSANQSSTDQTYPYYINWQFAPYQRGKRINDRLAVMQKATVDSMRLLQTDVYSIRAQDMMPALMKYLDATKLDQNQLAAYKIVKTWDKNFAVNSVGATIFSNWWIEIYKMIWSDDFGSKELQGNYPSMDRTEKLILQEPDSKWFDNIHSPAKETCAEVINHAFVNVVDSLTHKYGQPGKSWQWGTVKPMEIAHLTRQEALSSGNFETGGTGSTVNALIDGHGPSWRMVVQMGPTVKGYGILPGGESGNPGSFFYDDMLKTWQQGQLKELLFMQSPNEKSNRIKTTLTISNKK